MENLIDSIYLYTCVAVCVFSCRHTWIGALIGFVTIAINISFLYYYCSYFRAVFKILSWRVNNTSKREIKQPGILFYKLQLNYNWGKSPRPGPLNDSPVFFW